MRSLDHREIWGEQSSFPNKREWPCLLALLGALAVGFEAEVVGQSQPALLPKLEWLVTHSAPLGLGTQLAASSTQGVFVAVGGAIEGAAISKYDNDGNLLWSVTNSDFSVIHTIQIRADTLGNGYVAGTSGSDMAAAKYGPQGEELWLRHYHLEGSVSDTVADAQIDPAGNLYLTGTASNGSTNNILTLKYDPNGTLLWTMLYSGPLNNDSATSLAVDAQENSYVTGTSSGFGTGTDIVTIKYDPVGNQLWVARYNGPDNGDEEGRSCAVDGPGNVYVTGHLLGVIQGFRGGVYHLTVKYDSQGNQQWTDAYQEPGYFAVGGLLSPDGTGGVYVAANFPFRTSGHARVFRYDGQGSLLWNSNLYGFHTLGFACDYPVSMALDKDGNALVALNSSYLKFNRAGNILWTATLPGQPMDNSSSPHVRHVSMAVDELANIYAIYRSTLAKYIQTAAVAPAARILLPSDDNTVLKYPSDVFVNATATELPAKMEFWDGTTKVGESTFSPFVLDWKSVPGGSHTLTARFTSASGTVITSPPVHITIITNFWPSVTITNPTDGAYFVAPASFNISAQARDLHGSVTNVSYFAPNLIGQATTSPYILNFNNVPAGMYTLTAKATDNEGAVGTSLPVRFTVLPADSPPVIAPPLQTQSAFAGTNFTWAVLAYGPPPLQYGWQFNGTNLAGQTNATLSLTNVQGPQAGNYTLVVSNQYGHVSSSVDLVIVSPELRFRTTGKIGEDQVHLGLSAPVGESVTLETSTNWVNWSTLQTFTVTNQDFDLNFTIEPQTFGRFYRLSTP